MQNHITAALKSELAAVQRQMIASGIAPFLAGVIIIIAGTFLIRLANHIRCFLFRYLKTLHDMIDAELHIGMDKDAQAVWMIGQCVICASADDNTGFLFCKIFDCLKLCKENLVVQRHIQKRSGTVTADGIGIHYQRIEKTACRLFIMIFKDFLTKPALLCCQRQ